MTDREPGTGCHHGGTPSAILGDRKAHWLTDCPFDLAGADHAEPVALSGDLPAAVQAIFG